MEIIPVLDILNTVVVRGVAGQREQYHRVNSRLTPSCDPSVIMRAFAEEFDLRRFYIADLDAIQFQRLNRCTIAELARGQTSLIVDRGVRSAADVEELLDLGVGQVVVALETLDGPDIARALVSTFGAEQLVLSLDLKNGQPLTTNPGWSTVEPFDIALELIDIGLQHMIVLDLAAVGVHEGTPTIDLCRRLRSLLPDGTIITGGGVSDCSDLRRIEAAGVDGALVASALHDGRLSAEDVRTYNS
ncbi:MAG TPA: hisA/hisF family protein [Planctomycetes bacterium]|nr:hisA/hisF family protein [Fuerstiella sp.]HIK90621.1 hisA/hisF family protein [Planctomycetota bacterium]